MTKVSGFLFYRRRSGTSSINKGHPIFALHQNECRRNQFGGMQYDGLVVPTHPVLVAKRQNPVRRIHRNPVEVNLEFARLRVVNSVRVALHLDQFSINARSPVTQDAVQSQATDIKAVLLCSAVQCRAQNTLYPRVRPTLASRERSCSVPQGHESKVHHRSIGDIQRRNMQYTCVPTTIQRQVHVLNLQ